MTLTDFLIRLLRHAVLAATVWFAAVLLLERLLPGSVTPFVDLPYLALFLVAAFVLTLSLASTQQRISRIVGIVCLVIMAVIAGSFLWSRLNDLGSSGIVLMVCAIAFAGLTVYAFAIEST